MSMRFMMGLTCSVGECAHSVTDQRSFHEPWTDLGGSSPFQNRQSKAHSFCFGWKSNPHWSSMGAGTKGHEPKCTFSGHDIRPIRVNTHVQRDRFTTHPMKQLLLSPFALIPRQRPSVWVWCGELEHLMSMSFQMNLVHGEA